MSTSSTSTIQEVRVVEHQEDGYPNHPKPSSPPRCPRSPCRSLQLDAVAESHGLFLFSLAQLPLHCLFSQVAHHPHQTSEMLVKASVKWVSQQVEA